MAEMKNPKYLLKMSCNSREVSETIVSETVMREGESRTDRDRKRDSENGNDWAI